MKFNVDLPYEYGEKQWILPPLKDGKITRRTFNASGNLLHGYSFLARDYALRTENNPENFLIDSLYLVGSSADRNRVDSDIDLLLICNKIDSKSADNLINLKNQFLLKHYEPTSHNGIAPV